MFTEDLSVFLSLSEFAVSATLPGGASIAVIYDQPQLEVLGVSGANPSVLGRASDFSAVTTGDSLTVDGTAYTVRGLRPDGTGLVAVELES